MTDLSLLDATAQAELVRSGQASPTELVEAGIERIERLVDFSNIKPAITEAVARLPEAQAQAVALRIGDELPYREVADRLGCTEGTARVRVSRALTTLAEELGALR